MAIQVYSQVGRQTTGQRRRKSQRGLMSEINVTPFVDVMLVLLVIFMVTAPLLTAGVQVELPKATNEPLPGQDEPLEVTVAKDGKIYIQDTNVAFSELATKLLAISERNMDARIFVRGDKMVDYGQVISVISAINSAGFSKVGLVTENIPE